MTDKKQINEQLLELTNEGVAIYFASVVGYNKDYYKDSNEKLQKTAEESVKKIKDPKGDYYVWYDKAYEMVRLLLPRRLEEFEKFYTGDKTIRKKADLDDVSSGITHYLQGWASNKVGKQDYFFITFKANFRAQRYILESIKRNIDNDLFNMESDIHYGLAKSEIDIAKELRDNKFFRASGAIAGVVIEGHLKIVVVRREIHFDKKHTMSNYNDALKRAKIYTDSTWRLIQRCADIRNNCVHAESVSPDEIDDIIRAAEKIIAEFD